MLAMPENTYSVHTRRYVGEQPRQPAALWLAAIEEVCFMAKTPANHRKPWTPKDEKQLEKLADGNTPTRLIAHELDRTEDAIRAKASELDISLKPTNQSPYNRRKS
jgi:hypothetical protein